MESVDFLYIALAVCALWITLFLSWLIWQLAMILKNVNETMTVARDKIIKIEEAITGIRSRFEKATSGINILTEGFKKVIEYTVEKRRSKIEEE